ncbi:hypothetical protein HAX54_051189, partial [Datura stramonium]|nr:hypothetical protein [Datura stramonium]
AWPSRGREIEEVPGVVAGTSEGPVKSSLSHSLSSCNSSWSVDPDRKRTGEGVEFEETGASTMRSSAHNNGSWSLADGD